jgi:excisionase family DNA binding protein
MFVCPNVGRPKLFSYKALLSLPEFSVLAGISPRTTAKLVANGELRSIRIGRRRLVPYSELERIAKQDHSTVEVPSVRQKKVSR